MPTARDTAQAITDWFQNRLLGSILTDIKHLKRAHRSLEARMSALGDYVRQFRSDVDAETTRISGLLADLKSRLDSGDANAAAEVSAELAPVIDNLRAMGTGAPEDPVPAPELPADDGTGSTTDSGTAG